MTLRHVHGAEQPRVRACGYVRVSTETQRDVGVSLEVQQEKIAAMCRLHDLELVDLVVDGGESASSLNRPGMTRLLALVDARAVDTVIVAKLDRLTRSVRDLADLLDRFARRGCSLISVGENLDTASASGRLVMNIMASVSQWEREAIGERTAAALQHLKTLGRRVGGVPYGYEVGADGRHLEPNAAEQDLLALMRALRAEGRSFQAIADELNRRGLTTRRQSGWRYQYICSLLQRP